MSINGKREHFSREDFIILAAGAGIKRTHANQMVDRVIEAVRKWPEFANSAQISEERMQVIQEKHLNSF
jgi:serine/threonine-protein kinase HipA